MTDSTDRLDNSWLNGDEDDEYYAKAAAFGANNSILSSKIRVYAYVKAKEAQLSQSSQFAPIGLYIIYLSCV